MNKRTEISCRCRNKLYEKSKTFVHKYMAKPCYKEAQDIRYAVIPICSSFSEVGGVGGGGGAGLVIFASEPVFSLGFSNRTWL